MGKIIPVRYYDFDTVSNKFAVGERIEWITHERSDGENNRYVFLEKGIIRHIRPRVVILATELPNGVVRNWRIERYYLVEWILDTQLRDDIDKWEGNGQARKPTTKRKAKEDNDLHTAYGLADPRDGVIRYIGVSKNVKQRFKEHLTLSERNFKKNDWIQELSALGLKPVLVIFEEGIQGTCKAQERETYWIRYYLSQGAPLTNFAKMRGVEGRDIWYPDQKAI